MEGKECTAVELDSENYGEECATGEIIPQIIQGGRKSE